MTRNFPNHSIDTLLANQAYSTHVLDLKRQQIKQLEANLFNDGLLLRNAKALVEQLTELIELINQDLAQLKAISYADDEGTP